MYTLPIILASFSVLSVLFIYRGVNISKKRKSIKSIIDFVTTDFKTGEVYGEAGILGLGATATTIYSIYDSIDDHQHVLDVIEQRYPNEMGDDSHVEWFSKVEHLFHNGQDSVNNYVSAYAGQSAENIVVDHLTTSGGSAELFESRTHPNDDVHVYNSEGTYTDYSVKSYSSVGEFNAAVAEHPASTHYQVNSELYEKLQSKDLINAYDTKGIKIIDGGFSNVALRDEGHQALDSIHHAGDVADHIPFIGLALLGVKSGRNIYHFSQGKQSGNELTVNLAGDTVGIGAKTGAAIGGAKLGMLIGTAFGPGVGTIIGGGIGAITAGIVSGKIVHRIKEWWKWGDINEAQLTLGTTYIRGFTEEMRQHFKNQFFKNHIIQKKLSHEQQLYMRYRKQLKLSSSEKATIPAVLSALYFHHLNQYIKRIDLAVDKSEKTLYQMCDLAAISVTSKHAEREKVKKHYIGEIILSNKNLLLEKSATINVSEMINKYEVQKRKNPNYPYRFNSDAQDILKGVTLKTLLDIKVPLKSLID